MSQEIIIIAAMADNRVIGKNNTMPFSVKGNLARFKEMTMGWPCVMGRKTWESLPKRPLPGRLNIIVSKTINSEDLMPEKRDDVSGVRCFDSLSAAVEFCKDYEKIFICGGESIYRQSMQLANKIDLTVVPGQYEGDAFFPEIGDNWKKTDTVNLNDFSVVTFIKINQELI